MKSCIFVYDSRLKIWCVWIRDIEVTKEGQHAGNRREFTHEEYQVALDWMITEMKNRS